MNESTPIKEDRMAALSGLGTSRKRVEDARFTQGKGNYVDDMKLPGMLFGDFVRSPYAHARIKSINTEAALAIPGVHAVLTAADLEPLGLHWMPTLAGDKQMVLADGKVLFQGQEVAFVVADDRYVADDGIQEVVVEYEELPVLVDPFKAETDGAPILREDIAEKKEGAHGPRRHPNHIFTWNLVTAWRQKLCYQKLKSWPKKWFIIIARILALWKHVAVWHQWTRSMAS